MKTDYLKFIETLVSSDIKDKAQMERESRALLKKYFSKPFASSFDLLNPTYKSRVNEAEWVKEAEEFDKEFDVKFKIRKIIVKSGCIVVAKCLLNLSASPDAITQERNIQLIRESAPYEPDPNAELKISGLTVPPFLVPTK